MSNQLSPKIAVCPACGADIKFRNAPYVGQVKICPECDTELEVISKAPLELDYASFDDDEDDEYDDRDDEEF